MRWIKKTLLQVRMAMYVHHRIINKINSSNFDKIEHPSVQAARKYYKNMNQNQLPFNIYI